MSLSGSSDSRNRSWAMTTLATSSSIGGPRKTIRSLSRREWMSYARSPRWVCSITIGIGMYGIAAPFGLSRLDGCAGGEDAERLLLPDPETQRGAGLPGTEVLPHAIDGDAVLLGEARDLLVVVRVGDLDLLRLR